MTNVVDTAALTGGRLPGTSDVNTHSLVQRLLRQLRHDAVIPAVALVSLLRQILVRRRATGRLRLRPRAARMHGK